MSISIFFITKIAGVWCLGVHGTEQLLLKAQERLNYLESKVGEDEHGALLCRAHVSHRLTPAGNTALSSEAMNLLERCNKCHNLIKENAELQLSLTP